MLEMITPVNDVFRRDVELADPTLLDPTEPTALVQGEWLTRNSSGKGLRVTVVTERAPMQMWTEKGDFSAQAIGKVSVLQLHEYEAQTDIFKSDDTFAVGSELTIDDVALDGVTRSLLKLAVSTNLVHAICTKPPQDNGGKLRFIKRAPFVKP